LKVVWVKTAGSSHFLRIDFQHKRPAFRVHSGGGEPGLNHWDFYEFRLSVLWLLEGLTYAVYLGFVIIAPGMIDQIRSGTINGASAESAEYLFEALFFAVLLMAFLSTSLNYRANRWINVAAGAIIALLEFFALTQTVTSALGVPATLLCIPKVVIPASVVWFACKWPRPPN